jgi:hypothetical protein
VGMALAVGGCGDSRQVAADRAARLAAEARLQGSRS